MVKHVGHLESPASATMLTHSLSLMPHEETNVAPGPVASAHELCQDGMTPIVRTRIDRHFGNNCEPVRLESAGLGQIFPHTGY